MHEATRFDSDCAQLARQLDKSGTSEFDERLSRASRSSGYSYALPTELQCLFQERLPLAFLISVICRRVNQDSMQ